MYSGEQQRRGQLEEAVLETWAGKGHLGRSQPEVQQPSWGPADSHWARGRPAQEGSLSVHCHSRLSPLLLSGSSRHPGAPGEEEMTAGS